LCLLFALFATPTSAILQSGSQDKQTAPIANKNERKEKSGFSEQAPAGTAADKKPTKTTVGGPASDSEIAAAKASGKVWVNLDSGVYHKGGRWYGKTKNGKFMTTDEAKKAGYREAKRN
jgi:hypothetical protein